MDKNPKLELETIIRNVSAENKCLLFGCADKFAEAIYEAGYSKQEWISVYERLPDKYGDYICCTSKGTIWQLTYNPKYKLFNVSHDNVENAMNVTHWMPFPEAPKGGTE